MVSYLQSDITLGIAKTAHEMLGLCAFVRAGENVTAALLQEQTLQAQHRAACRAPSTLAS